MTPSSQELFQPDVVVNANLMRSQRSNSAYAVYGSNDWHEQTPEKRLSGAFQSSSAYDVQSNFTIHNSQHQRHQAFKYDHLCPKSTCRRHLQGFGRRWNLEDHVRRRHPELQQNSKIDSLRPISNRTSVNSTTSLQEQPPEVLPPTLTLHNHQAVSQEREETSPAASAPLDPRITLVCLLWKSFYPDCVPSDLAQQHIYDIFGISDTSSARSCFTQLYSFSSLPHPENLPPSYELHFFNTFLHIWRLLNPREALSLEKATLIRHLLRWPGNIYEIQRCVPELEGEFLAEEDFEDLVRQLKEIFKHNQRNCADMYQSHQSKHHSFSAFQCTAGCGAHFLRKKAWIRHEEKNWRQRVWCCRLSRCCKEDPMRRCLFSEEEYKSHLATQHKDYTPIEDDIRAAEIAIESQFPRYCHLQSCSASFQTWDERIEHLAKEHFAQDSGAWQRQGFLPGVE